MNPNNPNINFTPGPSQLYFTVADHIRTAFRDGIPSISHRSKAFENIYRSTLEGLRELLNLPADYHVFFTGSATEIWERMIQNLVDEKSFHLVNGAFSKRFFEIAGQLGKNPEKLEAPDGQGFDGVVNIPNDAELIAVTQNETSTGVSLPLNFIYNLKIQNPHALLAVDAVSSLPFPEFDYGKLDSVFFSVQKGFGLPAGLGVWLVNDRCISRAEILRKNGTEIGTYHSLPSLRSFAVKNQTPETPNVLGIYLLDMVVKDMIRRGINAIRRETDYKAALLYHCLEKHGDLSPFVKEAQHRSRTVIVASSGAKTEEYTRKLMEKGIMPGDGYGSARKSQLRFANFPTHSKEQFELLVDTLG
jgi:phosphoserine aminotransferase